MKKFIAGIVMTGLIFMALATGAGAKSYNGGGNYKQSSYKGNASCTAYEYYADGSFGTC